MILDPSRGILVVVVEPSCLRKGEEVIFRDDGSFGGRFGCENYQGDLGEEEDLAGGCK